MGLEMSKLPDGMMNDNVKLSERIRPNCEAAPWVIDEVRQLERLLDSKEALTQEIDRLKEEIKMLHETGWAVVNRWDTPLWKHVPATAQYINGLRAALACTTSTLR